MVANGWWRLGLNPISQKPVDSFLEAEMAHHWLRTETLDLPLEVTRSDDWTLLDTVTGEHLARIYNRGDAELLGSWRWMVAPFNRPEGTGSARNFAQAKRIVERLLASQEN